MRRISKIQNASIALLLAAHLHSNIAAATSSTTSSSTRKKRNGALVHRETQQSEFGRFSNIDDLLREDEFFAIRELQMVSMSMSMSMSFPNPVDPGQPVTTASPTTAQATEEATEQPTSMPTATLSPTTDATASPTSIPTDSPTSTPTESDADSRHNSDDLVTFPTNPPTDNSNATAPFCGSLQPGGNVELLLEVDAFVSNWEPEALASILRNSLAQQLPACDGISTSTVRRLQGDADFKIGDVSMERDASVQCTPQSTTATLCDVVKTSVAVYGAFNTDSAVQVTGATETVTETDTQFYTTAEALGVTDIRFYQQRSQGGPATATRSTDGSTTSSSAVIAVVSAAAGAVIVAIALRHFVKARAPVNSSFADASTAGPSLAVV